MQGNMSRKSSKKWAQVYWMILVEYIYGLKCIPWLEYASAHVNMHESLVCMYDCERVWEKEFKLQFTCRNRKGIMIEKHTRKVRNEINLHVRNIKGSHMHDWIWLMTCITCMTGFNLCNVNSNSKPKKFNYRNFNNLHIINLIVH